MSSNNLYKGSIVLFFLVLVLVISLGFSNHKHELNAQSHEIQLEFLNRYSRNLNLYERAQLDLKSLTIQDFHEYYLLMAFDEYCIASRIKASKVLCGVDRSLQYSALLPGSLGMKPYIEEKLDSESKLCKINLSSDCEELLSKSAFDSKAPNFIRIEQK